MSEISTAFRIIEAADTPTSLGPGDLALTIAWPDGSKTVEHVSEQAAKALGYRRPEGPPAPPAWMVEVAREADQRVADVRWFQNHERTLGGEEAATLALRLAIERGHVVEPRPAPSEEELLKAAREDAAQFYETIGSSSWASSCQRGSLDNGTAVVTALQARRNMLKEGAVAAPTNAPGVDLEAPLKRVWDAAFIYFAKHGLERRASEDAAARREAVSSILSTLPTREA